MHKTSFLVQTALKRQGRVFDFAGRPPRAQGRASVAGSTIRYVSTGNRREIVASYAMSVPHTAYELVAS
eukprot:786915-Rhodomonas_salina.1